ncbi:glutathione S-transferase alpha-3-like [Microtus ochrogaster]|uniref:glutathione transferase n=1 Tax=Microtus ochrogaster TaxID=79684 RepID=A0ABM1UHE0_MICOH|nr:glutathione S-transferase alpha-3-like [Microtus ochrogaster]
MAGKPVLYYFDGRGRMESIRWLLAAAGVEFEEKFLKTRDDLERLRNGKNKDLNVPERVSGYHVNLYTVRLIVAHRVSIDMYTEGLMDLDELVLHQPYLPKEEKEGNLAKIKDKARNRYFPAYEKLYHVEELDPSALDNFPLLKALRTRVSNLPTVKKFLQPGSQRKPLEDEKCVESVMKAFT